MAPSNISRAAIVACVVAASLFSAVSARAQNLITTVGVGTGPNAVVVNPVTNRIYVANSGSNTVSVLNGITSAVIATVNVGTDPVALAVNPVTNEIYVANEGSITLSTPGSVSVINGATNAVTSVTSAGFPVALAVNSVTNKIYVAASGISPSQGNVTVIDGANNNMVVATVSQVSNPLSVAVNPVTNKVYVANSAETPTGNSAYVTIIDGANNYAATSLNVGTTNFTLGAIAVNPVTNQIYAAGQAAGNFFGDLFQIDGASATVTFQAAVGDGLYSIVVNPVTNTVYLADGGGEAYSPGPPTNYQVYGVWVFNGANVSSGGQQLTVGSTTLSDVSTGTILPYALAVNPTTNQIYVGTYSTSGAMTVINGANNSLSALGDGATSSQTGITVNPVINRIYVANYGGSVSVIDGTVTAIAANPATGNFPMGMVLNPVTKKIYAVNFIANDGSSGTVTVIDAQTHAVTSTIPVGVGAWALDVNPVTNTIYVVCTGNFFSSGYVYVIDGNTDTVTTSVAVGVDPDAVVVNPDTNKIFVTNYGYGSVHGSISVIDGATNTVSNTIATRPYAIAVNPVTNRVYYSNYHSVTVADGTTGATLATIATTSAGGIAVNPVSNKVYVMNNQDNNGDEDTVTVIDGVTNAVLAVVATALDPVAIAINPVTNMVYVADQGDPPYGYVTVINGATNVLAPISLGGLLDGDILVPANPTSIAVNPVTNKFYVGDFGTGGLGTSTTATGNTVTVIDANHGNSTVNVTVGNGPEGVIVNPVTDEAYVLSQGTSLTSGGNVTVVGDHQNIPLTVSITPLVNNQTASSTPTLLFTAQSTFSPTAPPPQNVYFQVDSLTGPWTITTPGGSSFSGTVASLAPGLHTLYAYADDGQSGTSTQPASPLTGAVSVYEFVVTSPATQLSLSVPTLVTAGTAFTVNVVALDAFGNPAIGYTGTVALTSSDSSAQLQPASGALTGIGTFSATLDGTPGVDPNLGETITATDTVNPAITGTTAPGIEVIKPIATVNVAVPSPIYDGAPHGVTVGISPSGAQFGVTYTAFTSGAMATSTPPTAAGDYEVKVTSTDPVYYFSPITEFLYISQATPPTSWATPADVPNGTALSPTQLDATSTVPGAPFVYSPAAGIVLPYGPNQILSATFTPTDSIDYSSVTIYTTLTVDPPPPVFPAITAPPASQVVTPGGPVTFTITATGFPVPTYQWYFNNAPIAGATGSTLNIPVADAGAVGAYTVTATNSQGSVTSTAAALAVIVGEFTGDPSLSRPGYLTSDGVNLLVGGVNATVSDPNRNAESHDSIFSVPLPLGSGGATSICPAFNPLELAVLGGSIFWIDPDAGPLTSTQILSTAVGGSGMVNPIYTGTSADDPILYGSGLATDGTLLYAVDEFAGSVWSMNPDGSGLTQIGPNRYAGGFAAERLNTIAVKQGTLYIADLGGGHGTPAVLSIPTGGTTFTTVASGSPLVDPSGIAVGDGMIFVADPGAGNTVWEIPVAGGTPVALFSGSLGTPLGHLAGLAYSRGKLFVADSTGGSIYELQVATQAAPRISSALAASGVVQTGFTYQVVASGGLSPYTFAATGLPNGLSLDPNSGLITGTPTESGSFPVALTITDSTNPTALTVLGTLQLTIYALSFTSSLDVTGLLDNYLNYQVEVSGGSGDYTYAATGLPAGLFLDPVGGSIYGSPTQAGTFDVTLTVADNLDPENTGQATLQIAVTTLEFLSDSGATGIVNVPFSLPVAAYGGTPPYLYSALGLPAGLSLNGSTGLVTGTPTQTGTVSVTVTATDSADPANAVQEQLPISIESFGIPSPLAATGTVGTAFSYQPTTAGGTPPYAYTSSTLPPGLTLNPVTGAITGTPTQSVSYGVNLNVSDSSVLANTAYAYLVLNINPAVTPPVTVTVGPTTLPAATAEASYSQTVSASGGTSPYSFVVTAGSLPTGLSLSSGGTLSGTPTATGLFSFTITATDSSTGSGPYSGSSSYNLTVNAPTITVGPTNLPTATVGVGYSQTVSASGGTGPYSFVVTAGSLPAGLSLSSGGTISGTPAASGLFSLTITATDSSTGSGPYSGSGSYNLTVNTEVTPAISVSPTTLPAATVGASYSQTVSASGGTSPYTFVVTAGSLPAGLNLASGGTISGMPTTTTGSPFSFTITATDSSTGSGPYTGSQSNALTVNAGVAPVITSNLSAGATFGVAFSYTITGSSSPTSFRVTGLPGGLTVNTATGVISGTPTVAGTFDVTVGATNATGTGTATLVITVAPGFNVPVVSSSSQASGQVGVAFSYTILASNTPTAFSATGLPAGLTVSATTGVISGTPTAAGTFSVTLTASNAAGAGQAFSLSITIASAANTPAITSSATANGTVGSGFSYTITTSVAATSFAATGLPAGLLLNTATGVISGTPTASGTTVVAITATNATGTGAPLTLIVVIQPSAQAPAITSSLTAGGTQGVAFAYTITATNTPTGFAVTGLPSGLTVNSTTGAISGTPTSVGTTSVVLTASNPAGTSAAVILTIAINPAAAAPAIISGNTAGATVGTAFTYQIQTNPAASSYAVTGSPAWLGINTATGLLAGTPTGAPGVYAVVLSATNASGTSAPLTLTITVGAEANTPVVTSSASPGAATAQTTYADTTAGSLYQIQVLPSAQIQYYYVNVALPAGLSLDPTLGLIFGTPTIPGTYAIPVGAANGVGIGASTTITLTINAAAGTPTISNTGGSNASARELGGVSADGVPTASGSVGSAFSYQIAATGNPTSYAASNLPAGLAVNPSTGTITGIPTVAGTFTAVISASNGIGIGASTDLIITISPPALAPTVTSTPTATGTAGTAFAYAMAASNSPTSYNALGLPSGLALNSNTGAIAGTPTVPGVYTVSLSANNSSGTGPVLALTLTVNAAAGAPAITSVSTASGTVAAVLAAYQVTASNGPITDYSAINLPAGLVISTSTGAITGTPTIAGTYTATLTATNATGPSAPFALQITVAPAATSSAVTSASTAGATAGAAFSYQITASNAPTSFNVTGLPTGLSVNTTTGVISGSVAAAGSYPVLISVNNATGTGANTTLTISVINPSSYARLVNLSARSFVSTGSNILIAGFGIGGSGSKQLLLRGVGPRLGLDPFDISDALANAQLGLYDSGASPEPGPELIASDNGWASNPVTGNSPVAAVISDTTATVMSSLGAFAYVNGSLDSAVDATLATGSYSSEISGLGSNPTGVALAEVYDADTGIPAARLVNISARASIGTGSNILIAGFAIAGNTSETVLIRGIGPRLGLSPFYLAGVLAAPQLTLYDGNTPSAIIAANSGWSTAPTTGSSTVVAVVQAASASVMSSVGAFALTPGSNDAAMLVTLPPGTYTAQLSGVGGTTGIGLIEVYEAP